MLQTRIGSYSSATDKSLNSLAAALNNIALCPKHATPKPQLNFVRYAQHAAQGRANGPKDSAGRRLGAKKGSTEYVIPGNIIFKQRGTKWFPGENVGIGKDHTIYAKVAGYVRYYRNPHLHPKRRYIGVALEKEGPGSKLPTPPNAPTRRRLGLYATPIKTPRAGIVADSDTAARAFLESHMSSDSTGEVLNTSATLPVAHQPPITSSRSYISRMSNSELAEAMDRNMPKIKPFDRKDRWRAWRKRTKKRQIKMLERAARATRKTKGKKSNKKVLMGGGGKRGK